MSGVCKIIPAKIIAKFVQNSQIQLTFTAILVVFALSSLSEGLDFPLFCVL
jgi:Rad3-related DNA helicase